MYFKTLDKKECSGCSACMSACPKHSISMAQDEEGFFYPEIDINSCIECGLCEKVCPFEHPQYNNIEIGDVYASYVKDVEDRKKSTSGGIFYVLAKWVIEHGGIVYGAAFDDAFKLRHIGVDNLEDLDMLRGSKYLQSYIGNCFTEIKEYLRLRRWVYFTGVGCQVAGLNAFLRKKYDTLITSDLVCHGAPSQLMFDWHIEYLKRKEGGKITSYQFRKLDGWGGCESYTYDSPTRGKGSRSYPSYYLSPYLYAFMWAFNYRYSCYNCKFARLPRQGDITLGDFWGTDKYFPKLESSKGVSLVLVNTASGVSIWNEIKGCVEYRKSKVKDASAFNSNLIEKTLMPPIRTQCYKIIKQRGYDDVASHEFKIKRYYLVKLKVVLSDTFMYKFLKRLLLRILKKR